MISPLELILVFHVSQPVLVRNRDLLCWSVQECLMSYYSARPRIPSSKIKIDFAPTPLNFFKLAAGVETVPVYAPQPVPVVEKPKPQLSVGDKLALLTLRRSDAATAIGRALMAKGAFRPDIRNFRRLIGHGYARKNEDNRFHSITPAGACEADKIVRSLAEPLGVHVQTSDVRGWDAMARCCCGWSASVQRGIYAGRNLARAFARHSFSADREAELENSQGSKQERHDERPL